MLRLVFPQHLNKTYGANVPLVLMNSFNTDEDTEKILRKYSHMNINIYTFNQSRFDTHSYSISVVDLLTSIIYLFSFSYPRINKESYLPIARSLNGEGDHEG